MMERKFVKSRKAQKAADLRVSAIVSIQENKPPTLPEVAELVLHDYEERAEKAVAKVKEPSQKDLLLFPPDDFKCVRRSRVISTVLNPAVVCTELSETENSFTKECIKYYGSDYSTVQFKHANSSGSYFDLFYRNSRPLKNSGGVNSGGGDGDQPDSCDWGDNRGADGFLQQQMSLNLQEQKFELDESCSSNNTVANSWKQGSNLVKQGFLWKTPVNRKSEKSLFTKNAFKRRFFTLERLPDGSFTLNYWKDDKKDNMKGALNLEECLSANKVNFFQAAVKQGFAATKFIIELQFVGKHVLQIAAESQADQQEWLLVFQRAIKAADSLDSQSFSNQSAGTADDESYNSDISDFSSDAPTPNLSNVPPRQRKKTAPGIPTPASAPSRSNGGSGPSRDPALGSDIQRYCKETDRTIAEARKKDRLPLFSVYTDMDPLESVCDVVDNLKHFNQAEFQPPFQRHKSERRILASFDKLDFRLKVAQDGSKQYNMEPFFATIALYDVQSGCKLSEDVWIDVNPSPVWRMVRNNDFNESQTGNSSSQSTSSFPHVATSPSLSSPKDVTFRIPTDCNPDNLFFYIKIEKVLQGAISQSFDVYGRVGVDQEHKSVQKYLKQVHMFCQKFGSKFRTPFCWAAIPFPQTILQDHQNGSSLLASPNASFRATAPLLRIDQSKISADFVKRNLLDAKYYIDRPEKFSSRFTIIPDANITFDFRNIDQGVPPSFQFVNPYLVQLKQDVFLPNADLDDTSHKINDVDSPSLAKEAFMFSPFHFLHDEPCNEYFNVLYLNQISLKFDCQKMFAKARNISCCIKVLSDDSCQSPPLSVIYSPVLGNASQVFTNQYFTSLSHHNTTPDFEDEVKIELPTRVTDKHHLLFCFYHVSCDQISKLTTGSSTVGKKAGAGITAVESNVGYCWISLRSLIEKGVFNASNGTLEAGHSLAVAASITPGYLSAASASSTSSVSEKTKDAETSEKLGSSMIILNEKLEKIKFVDSGKSIFSFTSRIRSSVLPHSKFLRNLFEASSGGSLSPAESGRISRISLESSTNHSVGEASLCPKVSVGSGMTLAAVESQHIKAAHAIDENELVWFLPVILNQVLDLMTSSSSEMQINITRFLIHIAKLLDSQKRINLLIVYVRHIFRNPPTSSLKDYLSSESAVFHRLVGSVLSLLSFNTADAILFQNLLRYLWLFFDIVIKSMALHVCETDRFKLPRNTWFGESFNSLLSELVTVLTGLIFERNHSMQHEMASANRSLALFIKNLFSVMDRGLVLSLCQKYWSRFANLNCADGKGAVTLRLEFLAIVCQHEHFVTLNLPMVVQKILQGPMWEKDLARKFKLNEDFIRKHFLISLVLGEVGFNLSDLPRVRSTSILLLRDIVAKLSADSRYASQPSQTNVVTLLVPLVNTIVQNVHRMQMFTPSFSQNNGFLGKLIRSISTESLPETSLNAQMFADNSKSPILGSSVSHESQAVSSRRSSSSTVRFDILENKEVRDLLLPFLHLLKHLDSSILTKWWDYSLEDERFGFLNALKVCLDCFQYNPNKANLRNQDDVFLSNLASSLNQSSQNRPNTLRDDISTKGTNHAGWESKKTSKASKTMAFCESSNMFSGTPNAEALINLKDANLATEAGLVVLDTIDVLSSHFRKRLEALQSGSVALTHLFEIYLGFLRANHSEKLLQQAFASMRLLISKFPMMIFKGDSTLCGRMCFELIRCFSARLETTRYHSCMLLYLLMRNNFIFTARSNCTRVHLQSIVAVSQLVADVAVTASPRFQESLALLNNLANSDRGMIHTKLPTAVNDLTKTMRKVLIATSQMKEHEEEPEMLVNLQHSLADSYAGTPELRQTWLEAMAKIHSKNGYHSEAAMCYLHIAAMHAEYLKAMGVNLINPLTSVALHGSHAKAKLSPKNQQQPSGTAVSNFANSLIPSGKTLFNCISPNIEDEEKAIVEDNSTMQDESISQDVFVKLLEVAIESLWLAQRYELVPKVIQLVLPYYDRSRNYDKLIDLHQQSSKSYMKMVEVYSSGRRFLATYFRVAFFGTVFGSDDGQQYIYKEPNVTSLATISQRLSNLYSEKFGHENFKLLHDSTVITKNLDPKMGYLQITHVEPYFEQFELVSKEGVASMTDFDMHNNVSKFVFEVPFTRTANEDENGGASEAAKRHANQLNEQYIRKTILRTKFTFPYVEKRILVDNCQSFELSPIEVACESLKKISSDLRTVLLKKLPDMKGLQLKLQGCVGTQVNAGPLAYARAFLEEERQFEFPANKVKELKRIYVEFVSVCAECLELNGRLIKVDQYEFHENLKHSFRQLVEKLAHILKMTVTDKGTLEWNPKTVENALETSKIPAINGGGNSNHSCSSSTSVGVFPARREKPRTASVSSSSNVGGAGSDGDSRRNSLRVLTAISKTAASEQAD